MLQGRDVLELVHGEMTVLLADGAHDLRLGFQHPGAREKDVLEVELAPLVLELLVRAMQLRDASDLEPSRRPAAALRHTPRCCGA